MAPVALRNRRGKSRLLLTCEHASAEMPPEYNNLGLDWGQVVDHIGWDIGAAAVAEELSALLDATAVLSAVSRLLVDCNRDLRDHDLMPETSHGVVIPGNATIDADERERRLEHFYHPYHDAIDRQLEKREAAFLLSVHSFTPSLHGRERAFDVGVLFDDFTDLAEELARGVAAEGFTTRMNEPYSALDGLIFSARRHGRRHRLRYLEVEINNRLLRDEDAALRVAGRLAVPLAALVGEG